MGLARSSWSLLGRELLRRTHLHSHPRLFVAAAVAIALYFLLSGWAVKFAMLLLNPRFDGGAIAFVGGGVDHDGECHSGMTCGGAQSSKMKAGTRF